MATENRFPPRNNRNAWRRDRRLPEILQSTIERYASIVALISTPVFRDVIADTSKFEAGSAALSKRLVFDTLRAHALNDYDIEIQFTAASAADCRAAYRTIAERIGQRHAGLSDQNAKILQVAIDDYRERAAQLHEVGGRQRTARISTIRRCRSQEIELERVWNETREHLRQLEVIKSITTATTFPPAAEVYIEGPLVNNTVRLSALAGLAVILCAFVLAWLQTRTSRPRNTDT